MIGASICTFRRTLDSPTESGIAIHNSDKKHISFYQVFDKEGNALLTHTNNSVKINLNTLVLQSFSGAFILEEE